MNQFVLSEEFDKILYAVSGKSFETSNLLEKYQALGQFVKMYYGQQWENTNAKEERKTVYYFSMEFLPGKLMEKNLIYLGIYEQAKEYFKQKGLEITSLLEVEGELSLGNGELGVLAYSFLDSAATLGVSAKGYGIRYEKGFFRQKIEAGKQKEYEDSWLESPNIWEYKRPLDKIQIKIGGPHTAYQVIEAIPYDIATVGNQNGVVHTLRLWASEDAFSEVNKEKSITQRVYPDASHEEGKRLRLKQEYFLVSAGIQDLIREHLHKKRPIKELAKYVAIHMSDTHTVLVIPELMRVLIDEYKLTWEEAFEKTVAVCSFTNHTLSEGSIDYWDVNLYKELLPRIWKIIERLNEVLLSQGSEKEKVAIIQQGVINKLHLAIVGVHTINSVSPFHFELLTKQYLPPLYKIFPKKFQNQTSGANHRIWLFMNNYRLTHLIEEYIGSEFKQNPLVLEKLLDYVKDQTLLERLRHVKYENKKELSAYIYAQTGVSVNPYAIFDIQAKRMDEYKRQLLNILHIMKLYASLKKQPYLHLVPRVFIFAGKAAPGYTAAKEVIELIHTVANIINQDLTIRNQLKVIFLENYTVELAKLLIKAADVSEQIATPDKEIGGIGSLKAMMNGAVILGAKSGINVEIFKKVGKSNIILFGEDEKERDLYQNDSSLHFVVDQLVNGAFSTPYGKFGHLFDGLVRYGDYFNILGDFNAYEKAHQRIEKEYQNENKWSTMALYNIATSGEFSSDEMVKGYAKEIWKR